MLWAEIKKKTSKSIKIKINSNKKIRIKVDRNTNLHDSCFFKGLVWKKKEEKEISNIT